MKQDDLNTDMTAEGVANRLALRLADRYPMGSVAVDADNAGKNIAVTLTDSEGDSHSESFELERLLQVEDPLLIVLPRLITPDDVAKGKIIRTPTDEAAARAAATGADMPEGVIVTKPEADNIDSDEVTIAQTEAITPKINGVPVVVSEPNNAETADPETARAAAIKQSQERAELAGTRNVTINGVDATPVPEAADANADATRTRVRADADTASTDATKADAGKVDASKANTKTTDAKATTKPGS